MDLTYTNAKKEDMGTLKNYTFDLAFGKDENDFECTMALVDHCCTEGCMIYLEGTEYGGIIDKIGVLTNNKDIVYSGRTWHGMLEKKILCPDPGEDYLIVNGEANAVLGILLEKLGLTALFQADNEDSGIVISAYQFERYIAGYTGIRKMLKTFNAKLHITFKDSKVVLSALPLIDYSSNEEFDFSTIDFDVTKNYRPTNHLICLGTGNLSERAVIHLFTDENGGIQPYTSEEIPFSDSDYILDTSKQVLFDEKEVTEVYDCSNAAVTENYLLLESKPDDWEHNISSYYQKDDNEKYTALSSWEAEKYTEQKVKPFDWDVNFLDYYFPDNGTFSKVQRVSEDIYTLLAAKPDDWDVNFGNYYMVSNGNYNTVSKVNNTLYNVQNVKPSDWSKSYGNYFEYINGSYKAVSSVENSKYKETTSKPKDWSKNYGNYYYFWSDGTTSEYRKVSGVSKEKYVPQTMKPSDWSKNYGNYYYYKQVYKYRYERVVTDPASKIKQHSYVEYDEWIPNIKTKYETITFENQFLVFEGFEKVEKKCTWQPEKFFTKQTYYVAPTWEKNMYYSLSKKKVAPTWESGKYFTKSIQTIPTWENGKYYAKSVNTIPTWIAGKYYTRSTYIAYPVFIANQFYEKRIDRYAELVAGGIEKLKASFESDKINTSFEPETNYDIGDIVGAYEQITGISVRQPITKKIVKISNGIETINYEIGE